MRVMVRVMVQIDTADELMTTELMFNAVWKQLSVPQLVALLSCLVQCNEKDESVGRNVLLPLSLAGAMDTLQNFAKNICSITNVCLFISPCSLFVFLGLLPPDHDTLPVHIRPMSLAVSISMPSG
jgi:hypothetical protein